MLKNLAPKLQRAQLSIRGAVDYLNNVTGYTAIDGLKRQVADCEAAYAAARESLRSTKKAYNHSLQSRTQTQREINSLLQRKHTWTPQDVTRFTELYSQEHQFEQREIELRDKVTASELKMDETHRSLMDTMRKRYQEEQVWSDYIRSFSSYGTFGLMVVNICLFLIVQGFLEPRRRRRMKEDIVSELLAQKPVVMPVKEIVRIEQVPAEPQIVERVIERIVEQPQVPTELSTAPDQLTLRIPRDTFEEWTWNTFYSVTGAFVGAVVTSLLFK